MVRTVLLAMMIYPKARVIKIDEKTDNRKGRPQAQSKARGDATEQRGRETVLAHLKNVLGRWKSDPNSQRTESVPASKLSKAVGDDREEYTPVLRVGKISC